MNVKNILEELAPRLMDDIFVKKGELVLIRVGSHQLDLAVPLYVSACKKGAVAYLDISDDQIFRRRLTEVPPSVLRRIPQFPPAWAATVDVEFLFTFLFRDPELLRKIPPDRLGALQRADRPAKEAFDRKRTRRCIIGAPDLSLRPVLGRDYAAYEKMFWKAFRVPPARLREIGRPLRRILQKTDRIRITGASGTDLSFRIGGRPVFFHSGDLTPAEYAQGWRVAGLPAGEVFCAPHEDSADGTAVFEADAVTGDGFGSLSLEFKHGRVIKARADRQEEFFHRRFAHATGDKLNIAEFAFGINPQLSFIRGKAWDERTPGTIHIALGNNSLWGGKNNASIHWDFFMVRPTIHADGKRIMEKGVLTI